MEGIKETKELIEFAALFGNATSKSLEDKEISLGDALHYIPAGMAAPAALNDISKVPTEAADYSPEEIQALSAYFKAKFDIADDKIESFIEGGLEVSLGLAKMIASMRK